MGPSCLCIFRLLWGIHELPFLWEHWFMHENMYVCEQGENCFLLGFVCPVLLYAQVTSVRAQGLRAHVSFPPQLRPYYPCICVPVCICVRACV